jgi:molecular chaperone HtpG
MLNQIKTILGDRVKEVQLTNRLIDSPACIVAAEDDLGFEMQRILQAAGQSVPASKPIFEINPDHSLVKRLHSIEDDVKFEKWAVVLFEQAVLAEGGQLDNPADFVNRVNELLLG